MALPLAAEETGPRAKPPKWSQEVREIFFEDVRKKLVGKRPDFEEQKKNVVVAASSPEGETSSGWAKLIDEDSLTSEIKRVANRVAKSTSRVGLFKSNGHQVCQRDFRLLAIWFGVVSEFDEGIRWQGEAGAMREFLLRVAAKCEKGDDESFAVAQEAGEALAELMRGQRGELPVVSASDTEQETEQETAELGSLMQRLKVSEEDKIGPAVATMKEFRKVRYEIAHEGQMLAVLARVMGQEEYGYSEDETYLEYASELQKAAVEMTGAAREGDFQRVQQAGEQVKGACARCHEDYRG